VNDSRLIISSDCRIIRLINSAATTLKILAVTANQLMCFHVQKFLIEGIVIKNKFPQQGMTAIKAANT
jgi:hypothetical protein